MALKSRAPPHGPCFKTSEARVQNRYRNAGPRCLFWLLDPKYKPVGGSGEVMKKKVWILFGVALGAALFMLFQDSLCAVRSEETPVVLSQSDSAQAAPGQKTPEASPAVQIRLDKTSLNNHGTIDLSGTAPAGKPVYIEVWTDEKVRASRFDSEPEEVTGKRPYILYMTEQMPACYKILIPSDKQSVLAGLKTHGRDWSYSQALEDLGAENAFTAAAGIAIRRYQGKPARQRGRVPR